MKRKPKSERKKLIDELDVLSKNIAKKRDGNTCQKCFKYVEGGNRQGSHVIPVSAGSKLRWDPLNIKVLCHHCHLNWWHKNPMESAKWFEETFPDRWEYLQNNRGTKKFTIQELEELRDQLRLTLNS